MKHLLLTLLLCGITMGLLGCQQSSDSAQSSSAMTSLEAQAWSMIRQGALLVDVRTQEEYNQGHLQNASLIPYDQVGMRIAEFGTDKEKQIVLYCRSGRRAGAAEEVLRQNGFKNILNAGGYEAMMQHK